MNPEILEFDLDGKKIRFETGKIARQANGAVLVTCGETVILATACASSTPLEDVDFLPLRIDYQERMSSVGKTLSGFIKREGKPSEREILVNRLIDRPLRPFFADGYYHDTQVLAFVYSYDNLNKPDVLAICAASAALAISDIPLIKPISAVRVGMIDGNFILNPSEEELKKSKLDLILAGTHDAILMTEGFADFLSEEEMLQAVEFGHKGIQTICDHLSEWQKKIGKEKMKDTLHVIPEEAKKQVQEIAEKRLLEAFKIETKQERYQQMGEIEGDVLEKLCAIENPKFEKRDVKTAFKKLSSRLMRDIVLKTKVRIDGRKPDEVRDIWIEHGVLPRTHGSALFTRGETQAVAVCTLGSEVMGQRFEDLHGDGLRRFYLQYSFPPFCVGEVGRMGPPGRREVGHGKLAERSLAATLPSKDDFPYVIRLESNITESNGSSSMASVCGGCLSLMDAGVPIQRPVSGIAMGLILEKDNFVILSDILGDEDSLGDMDFKVAGDENGITAFQMDIKIEGITFEIMKAALQQARKGRIHILEKMLEVLPKSKKDLSTHAPRIETLQVKPSKIGTIIGPGGKQIRAIIETTGVEIDIDDTGLVSIASSDAKAMEEAKQIIHNLTAEAEKGKVYHGKITSIVPFGLFVEILPGKEGLCHISEVSNSHVKDLKTLYKEGDKIDVKVIDINDRGQIKLSHRELLKDTAQV